MLIFSHQTKHCGLVMESYGHRTNDIILEWKEDVPIRISDKVMNELIYSRFSKIKLSLHAITNAKISPWT